MSPTHITDQSLPTGELDLKFDWIFDDVTANFKQQSTGGTLTATGGEDTIYIDNEPLGCWRPLTLFVDLDNMAGGDITIFRVYYCLSDAGTLKLQDYQSYSDGDGSLSNGIKLIVIDLYPNRHGFQVTLEQTDGTNRTYPWELHAEI